MSGQDQVLREFHSGRSGLSQDKAISTRISDSSDVKVFILAVVCEETKKEKNNLDKQHTRIKA
jgi:hypothetical protein